MPDPADKILFDALWESGAPEDLAYTAVQVKTQIKCNEILYKMNCLERAEYY